ncbi:MAG: DMT family transporter [Tepidanaerobacteraceae bacterium]|nr:DMT family transporter [Tepidanaerobacteraceae bacterium]HQE05780.1 DMT family transporter [Tepidanaerobacteraceae bacterium]
MSNGDLKLAYFFALLHTLITGLSFLFVKTALKFASPLDVLAFRFSASLLALMVPIMLKKIHLNYAGKNLLQLCSLGLLYPIAFFFFQTVGLVFATSSEGGIIQSVTPIFTMILAAIFLKERTNNYQKIAILMSVAGVVYIFVMKGAGLDLSEVLGITLLLISALASAGYHILTRITTRQFSITEISFMMTLLGFVFFNAAAIIGHMARGSLDQFLTPLQNLEFVVSILYLGILSSLVTSLLNNYILKRIEAAKVSVFGNLRTVVTIFAGVYFLKEQLFAYHIIGSLMIILGVLGTNYAGKLPQLSRKT